MSVGKIRAIVKRPDERYGHVTNISPTLQNLQKTVGGYIETFTLMDGVVIICDEEGRIKGQPFNCRIPADSIFSTSFVGDIAVLGVDGDDFTDCPLDFKVWKRLIGGAP